MTTPQCSKKPLTVEQRERQRAYSRRHYAAHREEKRLYALAHAEEIRTRLVAWRAAHPEQIRDANAAYYAEHREEIRASNMAYNAAHRDERRITNAAYYVAHVAEIRAYALAYQKAHPEQSRATKRRRRAQKRGAVLNDFTAVQWRGMQEHYNHRCAYCGKRAKGRLTQDHITALSKGGSHTLSNIIPACHSCNSRKQVGSAPVFVQPLLLL